MTKRQLVDTIGRIAAHAQRDLDDDRMDRQIILEELLDRLTNVVAEAQEDGDL